MWSRTQGERSHIEDRGRLLGLGNELGVPVEGGEGRFRRRLDWRERRRRWMGGRVRVATQHADDVGRGEHEHLAQRVVEREPRLVRRDDRRVTRPDEPEMQDARALEMPFLATRQDEGKCRGRNAASGDGGLGESVKMDRSVRVADGNKGVVLRNCERSDRPRFSRCSAISQQMLCISRRCTHRSPQSHTRFASSDRNQRSRPSPCPCQLR